MSIQAAPIPLLRKEPEEDRLPITLPMAAPGEADPAPDLSDSELAALEIVPADWPQDASSSEGFPGDDNRHYVPGAGDAKLLTAAEEADLARQMEAGRDAEQRLLLRDLLPPERALLERLAERGREARRQVIEANLRLVMSVAHRYHAAGLDMEDLIQEGNVGLIKAADKFEWRLGYRFSTYAIWWIRQAISRAIADKGRTIRVPVHMLGSFGRVSRARGDMSASLGREPTIGELVAETGLSEEIVTGALASASGVVSLDSRVGEENGIALGDLIEDTSAVTPYDSARQAALRSETQAALECLAERERRVIALRFGLEDGQEHTLEDVGRLIGVTRERVRQIESKAFRKLRQRSVALRLHAFLE